MRPRSDVRDALLQAAWQLADAHGGATWRQLASAAVLVVDAATAWAGEAVQRGVGSGLARYTVKNMVRAGELQPVGRVKRPGSRHWEALYVPTAWCDADPATDAGLQQAHALWCTGVAAQRAAVPA